MEREALGIFPGALALMNLQDVKVGMKVVKVDGLAPGKEGYPLN